MAGFLIAHGRRVRWPLFDGLRSDGDPVRADPERPGAGDGGRAPTYPFFFARYVDWLLTTPLVLEGLYALANAPSNSRQARENGPTPARRERMVWTPGWMRMRVWDGEPRCKDANKDIGWIIQIYRHEYRYGMDNTDV